VPSGAETAALPPVWMEMSWDEKKHYLDDVAERVATPGVRVETRVMEGGVVPALERHAVRCAAGLVVMSTHGHVGLSRLWHHGVVDQLSRDLPLPMVLVRPAEVVAGRPTVDHEPVTVGNILIPLDGTGEAEQVVEHATTLGRAFSAKYTLLRVVAAEGEGTDGAERPGGERVVALGQGQTVARQYLNAVAERLRARSLRVETVVLGGEAAGPA